MSEAAVLFVIKDGSTYKLCSTVSVGDVAYKHQVEFYKWTKQADSSYIWASAAKTVPSVYTWIALNESDETKRTLELTAVDGADYFELAENGDSLQLTAVNENEIKFDENEIKFDKLEEAPANNVVTKTVAIREYANFEIVAKVMNDSTDVTKKVLTDEGKVLASIESGVKSGESQVKYYVGTGYKILDIINLDEVEEGYIDEPDFEIDNSEAKYGNVNIDGSTKISVDTSKKATFTIVYSVVSEGEGGGEEEGEEEVTSSISLDPTSLSLTVNGTGTLTATTTSENETVTWTSSNVNVATVDGGTVTAVAAGEATITASITVENEEITATCDVTVTEADGNSEDQSGTGG